MTDELVALRERFAMMPLDYMLKVVNAPRNEASNARRDKMAKAAAPYLHPRIAAVEVTGEEPDPEEYSIDLEKLTTEELTAFQHMMAKAGTSRPKTTTWPSEPQARPRRRDA
jgi:hypothetical protein